MSRVFVEPRAAHPGHDDAFLRNLERVAWLMDRAFRVPGTKISVGLDAILGLLPIGGDVLTGIVQAGLVMAALGRYRVPRAVAARMMFNVLIDVAVGSIPLLGDMFDVAFKANTRNIRLLDPYRPRAATEVHRPGWPDSVTFNLPRGGTSWTYLLPIGLALFVALGLVLVGFITVVRWIIHA
jgi:hypothetical protein